MQDAADEFLPTIIDVIDIFARNRPSATAMMDAREALSWIELASRVDAIAAGLVKGGFARGHVAAIIPSGGIWSFLAILSVLRAGGVVAPVSGLLNPADVIGLLNDCAARHLFIAAGKEELGKQVRAGYAGDSSLRLVVESPGVLPDALAMQDLVASSATVRSDLPAPTPTDPCNIIYSSGTTGLPKGIVQTHRMRALSSLLHSPLLRLDPDSRHLIAIPPHTNIAWVAFMASMFNGACFYAMDSFTVEDFYRVLEQFRPTSVFLVPTLLHKVLECERAASADFSCFRRIVSGGAPLLPATQALVQSFIPHCHAEIWGMTEGLATAISPEEISERKAKGREGSVGRGLACLDIRLIDEQGDEIEGPGTGEIVGRSPFMIHSYLNRPELTETITWYDRRGRRFLRSGDIAERDDDGYFYIRGRLKEMIISGGMNVFPADIEAVLVMHEAVQEVAVVGVPHDKWGETPVAHVVLRPGVEAADGNPETLRLWANTRLGKHQALSQVVIATEHLPRNGAGKILKNQLRGEYNAHGQ